MGKTEGRDQLEGKIETGLKEMSWVDVNWIYLAEDRNKWRAVVKTVMNVRVT